MNELLQAFVLGNTAILTNVCVLPLYPGLIAFLAGASANRHSRRSTYLLGFFVLAGVLSLMILIGWLLFAFQRSFGDILPFLLPVIYGIVIIMGLLMLTGRNPFARLGTIQTPVLRNPVRAARRLWGFQSVASWSAALDGETTSPAATAAASPVMTNGIRRTEAVRGVDDMECLGG